MGNKQIIPDADFGHSGLTNLELLSSKANEWTLLSIQEKSKLLREVEWRIGDYGVAYTFAKTFMRSKQVQEMKDGSLMIGGLGIIITSVLSGYCKELRNGLKMRPLKPMDFMKEFDTETSATAFDLGYGQWDMRTILYSTSDTLGTARFYRKPHKGEVVVVLAAGNQPFPGIFDVLYHLFVEGRVTLLKLHDHLVESYEAINYILQPLIQRGYIVVTPEASIDMAKKMVSSPLTDVVHLTGSVQTHDSIMWGTDEMKDSRRENNTPVLKKKMSSELGSYTPYVVMPSAESCKTVEWTQKLIKVYAGYAAAGLTQNSGCNCLTMHILILPEGELGDQFDHQFQKAMEKIKLEPAWYPGVQDRYNDWVESVKKCGANVKYYEGGRLVVNKDPDTPYLPFAIADLGVITAEDIADKEKLQSRLKCMKWAQSDPFAPVSCVVRIKGQTGSMSDYAAAAFKFTNDHLMGNLCCAVFIPPSSTNRVVKAVCSGELCYGAIVVNVPTFVGYTGVKGYWGGAAHAKNTPACPESGLGTVHNAMLIDDPRNAMYIRSFSNPLALSNYLPEVPPFVSKVVCRVLVKGLSCFVPWY
jgi:hypothetical protein